MSDLERAVEQQHKSLEAYHQAREAEAQLELIRAQQDLETERHIRGLQIADAAYNLAQRHPIATTVVGVVGFSLLWRALRRR